MIGKQSLMWGLAPAVLVLGWALPAAASGLFSEEGVGLRGTEAVSIEPTVGYLRGTSTEYVYDVRNPKVRVSHLDWNVDALAIGGRVAVKPFDRLTIRGRFWATVASRGDMTDLDWFAGYYGKDSWTHKSTHPNTSLGKAWQADGSLSYAYYQDEDLALTAIAGYRAYDVKFKARGGSYIYSTYELRDTLGSFPSDRIAISYEQWWDTPYLGLGAVYNSDSWALSTEIIGSPFVMSRTKDYHALRTTLFREELDMSAMVGASLGVEYRFSPTLSLAGRLEYQRYLEAKGGVKVLDGSTGTAVEFPKPTAGAEADTLLISVGLKARL